MNSLIYVALGGAIGAVSRYLVVAASVWLGVGFPIGTLLVNTAGSFAIGLFAAWVSVDWAGELAGSSRLLFQTGFLGAFTTFSAFSLETLTLWQNGHTRFATANVLLNVVLCLVAVVAGHTIGTQISGSK
ncbi:hypothetical protein AB833_17675 [Chromatiales bacterium (ex Bugula neritina AB1)]|nr:hypothetical protein AB833_17675 [Chromatiales bacterium (ex Bugula neritina AB1)]